MSSKFESDLRAGSRAIGVNARSRVCVSGQSTKLQHLRSPFVAQISTQFPTKESVSENPASLQVVIRVLVTHKEAKKIGLVHVSLKA